MGNLRSMRGLGVAFCTGAAFATVLLSGASNAHAQLHSDFGAQVGLEKRFLSSRGPGVEDAGPGLRADVRGHFAFFPFIRLGGYAAYAFAPQMGIGRHTGSLGAHIRLISPVPRTESFSLHLGVGLGYARTFVTGPTSPAGGYVEVPLGIGATYKVRKPLALSLEVQSVFGVGHHGDAYSGLGGNDGVALSLSLGALFDF